MAQKIISIDQSASLNTNHSFRNQVGWSTWNGKDLRDWGEFVPDWPHFKACRDWLRDKVLELSDSTSDSVFNDYTDVCVAVETVYYGKNVRLFQRLVSVKEHLHAIASDMGCVYLEITPMDAFEALCGYRKIMKSPERKEAMIASASLLVGKPVSEHIADSIGLGMAAYNILFEKILVHESSVGIPQIK